MSVQEITDLSDDEVCEKGDTQGRLSLAEQFEQLEIHLGQVPLEVLQRWLAEVNQILDQPQHSRFGRVETEIREQVIYVRPQPSYKIELEKMAE